MKSTTRILLLIVAILLCINFLNPAAAYVKPNLNLQVQPSGKSTGKDKDDIIHIPDDYLRKVLNRSIDPARDPDSVITREEIETVTSVIVINNAVVEPIHDLTGIEQAKNLLNLAIDRINIEVIPDLSNLTSLESLSFTNTSLDNNALYKFNQLPNLKFINLDENINITDITPLSSLQNLKALNVQFCGISDFQSIVQFPELNQLAAFGQNIGRLEPVTDLDRTFLGYNAADESLFIPFDIMPNRLTNFDGYQPPFTQSTSPSTTYLALNYVPIPQNRLKINEKGITVSGIRATEYLGIENIYYNAFFDNAHGTYEKPENYTFYSISSGTYLHKFNLVDTERNVTVKYYEAGTTEEVQPSKVVIGRAGETVELSADEVPGYSKVEPSKVNYKFTAAGNQEHIFYYTKNASTEHTVKVNYVDRKTNAVLQAPTFHKGKAGDILTLTSHQITVSDAVYIPQNFNHEYRVTTNPHQEYTFHYIKSVPYDIQQLTIEHLDKETEQPVKESTSVQGRTGEHFNVRPTSITVNGAVYHPEQSIYPYTFTSEPNQVLEIHYTKDTSNVEQRVTVKYLEQGTGKQLAESMTKSGKAGEEVALSAISVSGYTPVKASYTYTFTTGEGQECIFYYTKNTTNPEPGNPETGNSGGSTTTVTPNPIKLVNPPLRGPQSPLIPLEMENHYNYINGYLDGTIKPENLISREEVAVIFYRLMKDETRSNYMKGSNSYGDVDSKRWSNKHISTMENAGIITGYPDGNFKPERSITRAEFATIASRFDKLD
ncbi:MULTISPECIES: MucBP domain-containing protein [Paenibacillus]|nr:MucBP domain-containing protein [Paenibacillus dendritiformis]